MNVLIIDDDTSMCATLSILAKRVGHEPTCTNTIQAGMEAAKRGGFDIVILDVRLPDGNGLDILPDIIDVSSKPEVIIMTGRGDPDGAELAITSGAWDYIEKSSSLKDMTLPILRAAQYRQEKLCATKLVALKRCGIVGTGHAITSCLDRLAEAAGSEASVLITGETGTGKELFARAVHANSRRRDGNYLIVDCASLPDNLVESTLFGHARGAFTGAEKAGEGLLKKADGGTVLLDEVAEMPLATQKAFLRVLQEKRFRPVGGDREVASDFRLVSATNRDLDQMVQAGVFRRDLLFRLRGFSLHLPPLKDRPEDIKDLAMHTLTAICERSGMATKGFSPEFLEVLLNCPWPGNVRELVQAMEHTAAVARFEPTLFPFHLPSYLRVERARSRSYKGTASDDATDNGYFEHNGQFPTLKILRERTLARTEKAYLQALSAHCHRDARIMGAVAGIGKSRLYELLKKYGLKPPRH